MVSAAANDWQGPRAARLDALMDVADSRSDQTEREECERALLVALSAEFQAFCRDIHGLTVDYLVEHTASETPGLENILRLSMGCRELSRGNPMPDKIARDFSILGLDQLWQKIKANHPGADSASSGLQNLLKLRNSIAHGDRPAIPPTGLLAAIRGWRSDLDLLVAALDDLTAVYLRSLLGSERPW